MATAGDVTMFDEQEYEDEDEDFYDEEEFADADEGFNDPLNPGDNVAFPSPTLLLQNGVDQPPASTETPVINERKVAPFDDSRRLFQRLWTEEDEITILRGFLDFVRRRGTTHKNYQHDTGPFYEQIKGKIRLEFNKNQLIEKIRRLKKKYRTVDGRIEAMGEAFAFKSAHERATYEISKQIWHNPKRSNLAVADEAQPVLTSAPEDANFAAAPVASGQPESCPPPVAVSVPSIVEETVKCCLSPLFKELIRHGIGGGGINGGLLLNPLPSSLSLSNGLGDLAKGLNGEKWREQQILELEVYLKRVEMLEEHVKATLDELRSSAAAMSTDC